MATDTTLLGITTLNLPLAWGWKFAAQPNNYSTETLMIP
jgi:hypothetical protein